MLDEIRGADALSVAHERIGRRVASMVADYARSLERRPLVSDSTPAELTSMFAEDLPETGCAEDDVLDDFERRIVPHATHIPSPRYFGLFNPTPLPIAVWADALCSTLNQNVAAWRQSPSATAVETCVIRWLCELAGYTRPGSFGTLTSGGSEANLIALKCARDAVPGDVANDGVASAPGRLVVYASEQAHYSIQKAVDILGLGRAGLRLLATDGSGTLMLSELRDTIRRDREAGSIPICVVGVAGATSTGAIDPLEDLSAVARDAGCWFHVDAAYGAALGFSETYRRRLRGIDLADSITIDPHKWMFVPFSCAAVLVRDGSRILRNSFDMTPAYLSEDRGGADVDLDFFRYGQLGTRRFNALKVWMAIRLLGRRGYAAIIDRQVQLTEYFATRIEEHPDFELVGRVETAVCCFRYRPRSLREASSDTIDRVQMRLQQRVERSGQAWLASTVVGGRRVLRVNVDSFLSERRHLDDLLRLLIEEGGAL